MMHMLCVNIKCAAECLHQNVGFGGKRDDTGACHSSKNTAIKFYRERNDPDRGIDCVCIALCIYGVDISYLM